MITIEDIQIRYEYLCERVFSHPEVEFKVKQNQKKMIENFLKFSKEMTTDWLWQYLLFQFVNRGSHKYTRTPSINWILGEKAILRWNNRTVAQQRVLEIEALKYKFVNPTAKTVSQVGEEYKESQRKLHFNTPQGFLLCQDFGGFLYDRGRCFSCKYKNECKKTTENGEEDLQ